MVVTQFWALFGPFVGVLVGGLLTIGGQTWLARASHKRQREEVVRKAAAELATQLNDVIRLRQCHSVEEEVAAVIEDTDEYRVTRPDEYGVTRPMEHGIELLISVGRARTQVEVFRLSGATREQVRLGEKAFNDVIADSWSLQSMTHAIHEFVCSVAGTPPRAAP